MKINNEENLGKKEEMQIQKNDKNIYINKKVNKYSSFNNIRISSNNNKNNLKNGNTYSKNPTNQKEIQNLQITNINSDNNKYSNNNCHQGICFIANNPKEKSQKKFIYSKISSSQGISYIVPNKEKNIDDNLSNNYSESNHNEFTYIAKAKEKPKNEELKISSNFQNNEFNTTCQGISYIAKEQPKNNNFEIVLSSKKTPNDTINYIAPKKYIKNNYSIEYNPTNNKDNQNGISYIAQNSNNNETNNFNKNNNFELSSQNNTFTYIAPIKNKFSLQKINNDKNNFEISSNKNNYFYIAEDKNENEKKEIQKEKFDCIKFNQNESMTFICDNKKIDNNNNYTFSKCEGDNFKYIKDDATGAQILNE